MLELFPFKIQLNIIGLVQHTEQLDLHLFLAHPQKRSRFYVRIPGHLNIEVLG